MYADSCFKIIDDQLMNFEIANDLFCLLVFYRWFEELQACIKSLEDI